MCDDRYSNLLFILFDQKHNQFENDKVEEVEELNVTRCLKKNDLKKRFTSTRSVISVAGNNDELLFVLKYYFPDILS